MITHTLGFFRFEAEIRDTFYPWLSSCLVCSATTSFLLVYTLQRFFRFLYGYQLWMFMDREQMKRPSLPFKLWAVCVKAMNKISSIGWRINQGKPMLYSYQRTLPNLPLPSVQQTVSK